uniref:Beta C1 protein n=1 Tax=Cotton leaf curl Multan betasatellite TaxID=306025 RepID=Q8QNS1_9VIRU|nr:beta C1 protein [Cotton leaf curl Multan betasatellite]
MVKPHSHLQTTTFSDMFLFFLFFYYSQTMTFSNLYFFSLYFLFFLFPWVFLFRFAALPFLS